MNNKSVHGELDTDNSDITRPCGYKKDVMLYIGQIPTRKSHSSILSASNKKFFQSLL